MKQSPDSLPPAADPPISLPQQLRRLRMENRYTQADIAGLLMVARSTYAYYEMGWSRPSLETLVKLAAFYQVALEVLLGLEKDGGGHEDGGGNRGEGERGRKGGNG